MSPKELFDHLGHKLHKITCRGPCCGHEKKPTKGESRGEAILATLKKTKNSGDSEEDRDKHDPN